MASNGNLENPAFALEEDEYHRDQTGDEQRQNMNNAISKSTCRDKNIQINDDDDGVATNASICGVWLLVNRIFRLLCRRKGLLLAISSTFFFSVKSLFLKVLTEMMDPFQIVVMIMPILIVGPLVFLTYKRIPLPRDYILYLWLLLSGVSLSSYLSLFTLSLSKMEVADVVTIEYTSLIFVGFLSWLILKETPTVFYVVFSLLSFLGVVFIARPPYLFGSQTSSSEVGDLFIGTGFALGAAFSIAIVFNAVRKQTKLGIHAMVSVICNAVVVLLTSVVVCTATRNWRIPSTLECLYAFVAGLSYFLAHLALYLALKFETATFVTIALTTDILFTFQWQFAFLQVHPSWTSYVGAILVISACIGITLKEKNTNANGLDEVL